MISVIVPVYNAEKYLRRCLNSICAQTLQEMDIILMDDGSTDGSEKICDEYAERDSRIRVYHTPNQGHYLAREFALERAREIGSKYIGFVDADDWIEPDMYAVMLEAAETANADIVECGFFTDYPDKTGTWLPKEGLFDTGEALYELLHGRTHDYFWNKLWKTSCYDHFAFPPARAYADASICFKIFARSACIVGIPQTKYHYVQNKESIVHSPDMRLINMWRVNHEKYEFIQSEMRNMVSDDKMRELEENQMQKCVFAIGKNWAWWDGNTREERNKNHNELKEMSAFIREHCSSILGRKGWGRQLRVASFLARYPNRVSLRCAWILNRIDRRFRRMRLYS